MIKVFEMMISHFVTLNYLYGPIIGLRIWAQTITGCLHTSSKITNYSKQLNFAPPTLHHIMVCTILNLHYIRTHFIMMSKTVFLLFLRFIFKAFPQYIQMLKFACFMKGPNIWRTNALNTFNLQYITNGFHPNIDIDGAMVLGKEIF